MIITWNYHSDAVRIRLIGMLSWISFEILSCLSLILDSMSACTSCCVVVFHFYHLPMFLPPPNLNPAHDSAPPKESDNTDPITDQSEEGIPKESSAELEDTSQPFGPLLASWKTPKGEESDAVSDQWHTHRWKELINHANLCWCSPCCRVASFCLLLIPQMLCR